ncbi:MAG: thaumatin family protein [Burkholderiales bacterium]|nr:thaumatin family protein [Burkholderiales bacterium]
MKTLYLFFISFITMLILSGCGSGVSSNSSSNGYLSVSYNGNSPIGNIQVTNGSTQTIYVSLKNSTGVVGQLVNISVSEPSIASLSQSKCALSSGSQVNTTCTVILNGLALGSTSINVSSNGYASVSVPTISQENPVFGTFEVESSDGNFYSGSVNVLYSATAKTINLKARIFGLSGVESADNGVLNFAIENTSGATLTPNGAQACSGITTQNPNCSIPAWTVSGTANSAITFTGSVAGAITSLPGFVPSTLPNPTYPNITISATKAAATPGKIVVSTQSGNIVPVGMRAPIFVNWLDASEHGNVSLTLTSSNPNVIKFYSYNESGIESTVSSVSCNLSTATESELNCGFGVKQITTSGTSVISAKINSQSGVALSSPEPLVLTVAQPEAAIRTMTFTNSSLIQPIWVGITQGGANAFTSPLPNSQSTSTTHDLSPGAVSMCGLSNLRAACPVGSTCRPGGANGGGSLFCFWDRLEPINGYKIESHGGTTTFNISASSRDPNGIIWSGNFFARTKCSESGVCEVGSCGNGTGLACAPGTGAAPGGVVTLGEFTFQKNNNPDYYDVSIINGVNFGVSFGPNQTTNPVKSSNAYICGVAGSLESMATASAGWLPKATWIMNPDSSSYPSGVIVSDYKANYRWVDGGSKAICSSSSDCLGSEVCGYHLNSVYNGESGINQGANSDYNKYCGYHIAWLTADTIAGFGSYASPNTTPAASIFKLNENWANPVSSNPTIYVTNLQLCNINTFSSFATRPTPFDTAGSTLLACGGTLWNGTDSGDNVTRPNSGFNLNTPNTNWVNNVLPTITWLKKACPTCYTYPFDDPTSTFTCTPNASAGHAANYGVKFSDLK